MSNDEPIRMTGGVWRVTLESWGSSESDWHGKYTYVISDEDADHHLKGALAVLCESDFAALMARQQIVCNGERAPKPDYLPNKPEYCDHTEEEGCTGHGDF